MLPNTHVTRHNMHEPDDEHDGCPRNDEITRKLKVDVKAYDGTLEPKCFFFFDWLSIMDDYFNWYEMSDERIIRLPKMKLKESARKYWAYVVQDKDRKCLESIATWIEMKVTLKSK